MKIGIVSDSHDNLTMIKRAVEVFNAIEVEYVLHAGDYVAPFSVKEFLNLNAPLIGVYGNNDGEEVGIGALSGEIHHPPHTVVLDGKKILITHDISKLNQEHKDSADVVIHGHTHRAKIDEGRPLYINPGECGGWVRGKSTISILDLKQLDAHIITL